MIDILSGIVERFVSKKLGAFLASIFASYLAIQHLDMERAQLFTTYLQWVTGFYLGAQGAVDTIESLRKGVGIK